MPFSETTETQGYALLTQTNWLKYDEYSLIC